jgi:hypothetical protein
MTGDRWRLGTTVDDEVVALGLARYGFVDGGLEGAIVIGVGAEHGAQRRRKRCRTAPTATRRTNGTAIQ